MNRLSWTAVVFAAWLVAMWACSPSAPPPPPPLAYVLVAEKSMTIGNSNTISGGDVAVRQVLPLPGGVQAILADGGTPPPAITQLTIGKGSQVAVDGTCNSTATVSANSLAVDKNACVGRVQSNQVTNAGAVASQAAFPSTPLTPLPLAALPPTSATAVMVPASGTQSLSPGSYGDVTVKKGGTLTLGSGEYSFGDIDIADAATLTTDVAGGVTITALGLTVGQSATVAPATGLHASDLQINLSSSATFKALSSTTALVAAPHGDMAFDHDASALGAFAAFTVETKNNVRIAFQNGFAAPVHGSQQLSGYYGHQLDGSYGVVAPAERSRVFAISVGLPVPNPSALAAFIEGVSNPHSPTYHQFLTPSGFKAAFGATDADYALVERWAGSHNLLIKYTYQSNLLITLEGTAAQLEQALHINLIYRQGGTFAPGFLAVDREPSLDLVPSVLWITGFDDYALSDKRACNQVDPGAGGTSFGIGDTSFPGISVLTAADLRQAYLGNPAQGAGTSAALTTCQALQGFRQTVGILSLEGYTQAQVNNDRASYIAAQPSGEPFAFTGVVTVVSNISDVGALSPPTAESAIDMEAVMAMAPAANVLIFETPTGITSHVDDALHRMANDPGLTVATTSYSFGQSTNSEQALSQMAAEGISYFAASGDLGDIGDPGAVAGEQSSRMAYQTLVGGTNLFGGSVTSGVSPRGATTLQYSQPYYAGEVTWNDGCPAELGAPNDITGGGIMNGCSPFLSQCFPQPTCNPNPAADCFDFGIGRPGYQAALPTLPVAVFPNGLADPKGGSGASRAFRNYPDVAMDAQNFMIVFGQPQCAPTSCITPAVGAPICCIASFGGTSVASPLWAGYMALVNEQAGKNLLPAESGFINDTVYAIGATSSQNGVDNLYASTFHDINDGVFNQAPHPNNFGLGFPAVNGYDLATGWGSPTCALLNQLSSSTPLTPQLFSQAELHIESGPDGLNDVTSVDLVINTENGPLPPFHIKASGDPGWDSGAVQNILLAGFTPITPTTVTGVTVTMFENGQGGSHADNWDIGGLQLHLSSPLHGASWGCLMNVSGNGACDIHQPSCKSGVLGNTNDTGVARLSETVSDSGQGPSATFDALIEGCGTGWNPVQSPQPFDAIALIIDTGDDDLASPSSLSFIARDIKNNVLGSVVAHPANTQLFDNNTEHQTSMISASASGHTDFDAQGGVHSERQR